RFLPQRCARALRYCRPQLLGTRSQPVRYRRPCCWAGGIPEARRIGLAEWWRRKYGGRILCPPHATAKRPHRGRAARILERRLSSLLSLPEQSSLTPFPCRTKSAAREGGAREKEVPP